MNHSHTLTLTTLLLAPLAALPAADAPAKQPNILVIVTDDQGYGELSCHGNPVLRTPHLDRLYDESVRFTDFHVAPMCTPTRGQLLTGVDALRNLAMNVSSGRTLLRRDLPTMADLFGTAGYATGIFGKWHLGDNYPYRPQDRGFHETLWYPSSHIGSAPDFWDNDYFDDTYWHNGRRRPLAGYTTDVFFREAMRWMREQALSGKRFLCYLPTAAPHAPHFIPASYREAMAAVVAKANLPKLEPAVREQLTRYFAMIANIDENMGRIDAFLRETDLRDNTVVVFLSDNGSTFGPRYFNAGMKGGKVTLWEGGHRVPCFIRWPAGELRTAGDVTGLTEVQDLLPTLLDLAGVKAPSTAEFDGISLAGVLRGTSEPPADRALVVQFSRMNHPEPERGDACVLWQRWRLVQDKELYDLAADPAQERATPFGPQPDHAVTPKMLGHRLPAPPVRRRQAEMALEGAAEGRFGFIAGLVGDAFQGHVPGFQMLRRTLQAPDRQVVHGRHVQVMLEARRQHRTRHTHLARQALHAPVVQRRRVQPFEGGADHRVVERGEPAHFVRGQALHVLAQDLHEHQLGQARQHGAAARVGAGGLAGGVADGAGQPVVDRGAAGAHRHQRRQMAQQGMEQQLVALQEAADNLGAAAGAAQLDPQDVGPGQWRQQLLGRDAGRRVASMQDVAVAIGQQHGIARLQPDRLGVLQLQPAAASGDDVERDDVLAEKRQQMGQLAGIGRDHGPGFAHHDAEQHHAGEVHAAEQVRQQIRRGLARRFGHDSLRFGHGLALPYC